MPIVAMQKDNTVYGCMLLCGWDWPVGVMAAALMNVLALELY